MTMMDPVTIEISELRDAAQKAFAASGLMAPRDEAWRLMVDMGWLMTELPEEAGGLALGREASASLHFEMGRVLGTAPLVPAMAALSCIAASSQLADRAEWIDRILGGEYVPMPLLPARLRVTDSGALSGTVPGVLDADMASHVLVLCPDGVALVPLCAVQCTLRERPVWDRSRRVFDLVLDEYPRDSAFYLATGDAALAMQAQAWSGARLALAADSLGAATAALDLTIAYLTVRRQFDRPLAMFQALKHRCADLKLAIATAEALLWSRAGDAGAKAAEIGALKALACDTFAQVAEEMIQLHGGIGLTEEHHAHLFMKRAMLNLQLAGSADALCQAAGADALAAAMD